MKYLFLIGTQHQLVQVYSAIEHFNLSKEDTSLIVFEVQNEKFNDVFIDLSKFSTVKIFDNWIFRDLFLKRSIHKTFLFFCKTLSKQSEELTVFSSVAYDTVLLFMSIVKVQKLYFMDDGLSHFTTYYFFRSPARFLYILKLLIKSIAYGHFLRFNTDFIYLTEHDFILENAPNSVRYKIEKFDNPLKNRNEDEAIFLGTGIVEGKLMKNTNYLNLLSTVKSLLKNKTVYYYPHRREEISKLELIKNLGFIIKKIDEPFEKYFAKMETWPSVICSFYTTAVIRNLALRFENTPYLKAYKFDKHNLLKSIKESEAICKNLERINKIEVIEL